MPPRLTAENNLLYNRFGAVAVAVMAFTPALNLDNELAFVGHKSGRKILLSSDMVNTLEGFLAKKNNKLVQSGLAAPSTRIAAEGGGEGTHGIMDAAYAAYLAGKALEELDEDAEPDLAADLRSRSMAVHPRTFMYLASSLTNEDRPEGDRTPPYLSEVQVWGWKESQIEEGRVHFEAVPVKAFQMHELGPGDAGREYFKLDNIDQFIKEIQAACTLSCPTL